MELEDISQRLRRREFTEYPDCALCGGRETEGVLLTRDGCRIVRCKSCDLHFTSPRMDQREWELLLNGADEQRNVILTESRLRYGVAHERNAAAQPEDWRERLADRHARLLRRITKAGGRPIERLHDVGCGVGFFLQDARAAGLTVSGNEMNGYACEVMRERFGLEVYRTVLDKVPLPPGSCDAVTMCDFIEHSYNPHYDVSAAARLLRPGGVLHVHTFHIACRQFEEKGSGWGMLAWNHVYHFSPATLIALIEKGGFKIANADYSHERQGIQIEAVLDG